jgi:hypothetical protein
MWHAPATLALGVVAPAASDWGMTDIAPVFSVTACTLGLTTFFLGPWQERAGPRLVAAVAGTSYAGALALSGLGIWLHQLARRAAEAACAGPVGPDAAAPAATDFLRCLQRSPPLCDHVGTRRT